MNKGSKLVLVLALVLIAAGTALLALGPGDGVWRGPWKLGSFTLAEIDEDSVGGADYTVCDSGEERFAPGEVRRLDLAWVSGAVTIETGGDRIVLSESAERALETGEKLRWKLADGTLSLRFCGEGQKNVPAKTLTLRVPANWTPETLEVRVTSGSAAARGLTVEGRLELGATSGALRAENCRSESLILGTTSGSAAAEGCVCRRLEAVSTSGALSLTGCSCRTLNGGSTSGSVTLRCEAAEQITLSSTSGAIRVEDLPENCALRCGTTSGDLRISLRGCASEQRVEIDTNSGDVFLDAPGPIDLNYETNSGKLRGSLQQQESGCPRVSVDTTSGDLTLGSFR